MTFGDAGIKMAGLKIMMTQHSWYLGHELATVALFSTQLTS
jgi:hypothetical protein